MRGAWSVARPRSRNSRPGAARAYGEVIGLLADSRLLTLNEGTLEPAHEALLREWPRLRAWIEEDREGLRIERQLELAAREWRRLGRDEDALYRGARLAEARELSERAPARADRRGAGVPGSERRAQAP